MAKKTSKNENPRVKLFKFYQFLDSAYGKYTAVTVFVGVGFLLGTQSIRFIKDRELALMERQFNDINTEKNKAALQFENEKSHLILEMYKQERVIINLKDSLDYERKN